MASIYANLFIYSFFFWNKRKRMHKKRIQLPQGWFGTPTWPTFYCFLTPIWPLWRHVKTLYFITESDGRLLRSATGHFVLKWDGKPRSQGSLLPVHTERGVGMGRREPWEQGWWNGLLFQSKFCLYKVRWPVNCKARQVSTIEVRGFSTNWTIKTGHPENSTILAKRFRDISFFTCF